MAQQTQQDLTAIANYAGQYERQIRMQVFNGLDIATDLDLITNLTAPRILPKYYANEGLRPYDSSVEDADGQAGYFGTRTIDPRTAMKILEIIPEELRKTYLSEQLKANAKTYPGGFAQYYWEAQIKKQQEEINDNSYFGVDGQTITAFNGTATYVADQRVTFNKSYYQCLANTTAGQSPETTPAKWKKVNNSSITKGLGLIIADEYNTLPSSHKIATGAITRTDAFDQVTEFFLSIPERYRRKSGIIRCSDTTYTNYTMAVLEKFKNGSSFLDVLNQAGKPFAKEIYGSDGRWILQPASWMVGSGRLITDIEKNLKMGTDLTADFTSLGKMIETLHGSKCKFQMILAYQISDLETLFVNDQK